MQYSYPFQKDPGTLKIVSDSDWASCASTRKSTTGGVLMRGRHQLKHWTKLQTSIALSSGEAKLYAANKGVAEGIGVQRVFSDMGVGVSLVLLIDAAATKGHNLQKRSRPHEAC